MARVNRQSETLLGGGSGSRGGSLGSRVVAALGADNHLAVTFGFGIDADLAETAGALGSGWLVADSILIADVGGNTAADGVDFVKCLREKRDAAGPVGDDLQSLLGALGMRSE